MRWPLSWFFRAAAEPPPAEGAAPGSRSPGEGPAGPDTGPPGGAQSQASGAWHELPALRPTVARLELTAPTEPFQRDLAVNREPEPVLGHLGHDVRADGPVGLVSGLARPIVVPATDAMTPSLAGRPALPVRHRVQRHAGAPAATSLTGPPAAEAGPQAPPEVGLADVEEVPRPLPAVEPEVVVPALAATSVAPETAPPPVRGLAPLVGRLTATTAVEARSVTGVATPPAEPTAIAAAGGAPGGAATLSPAVVSTPMTPAAPATPTHDAADVQPLHRSLGGSRRLGLGAPVPAVPTSARPVHGAVSAHRAAPAPGAAPAPEPAAAQVAAAPVAAAQVAARVAAPAPARAAVAPLPVLRLARVEAAPTEVPDDAEGSAAPAGPLAWLGAAPPTAPATAPLVGSSPLVMTMAAPPSPESLVAAERGRDEILPTAGRGEDVPRQEAVAAGEAESPAVLARGPSGPPPAAAAGSSGTSGPAREDGLAAASSASAPAPAAPGPPARPVVARLLGERPLRPAVVPLVPLAAPEEPAPETGVIPGLEGLGAPARPAAAPTPVQALAAPQPAAPPIAPLAWPTPPLERVGPDAGPPADEPTQVAVPLVPPRPTPAFTPGTAALPVARLAAPRPAGPPPDLVTAEALPVQAILAAGSWTAAAGPLAAAPAPGELTPAGGPGPAPAAVQRQAETGAVESPVEGGGQPAAAGAAGGATGNRDQDMDELARKLYGRIRERLGAELLADRERAGLLVDA